MSTSLRKLLPAFAAVACGLLGSRLGAGVIVTQGTGPGATSFPGTPILQTVTNPASQATVGESFGSGANFTQTFTIPAGGPNYTMQTVYLYAGGGTGTTATATITVNVYDLGTVTAPNPSSYAPGTNLLGGGAGLPITYVTQANGLLKLDFTGADQLQLVAGREYAFEIAGTTSANSMFWYRTGANTYAGGAAYRNRSHINGTNARDFALALYGPINTDPLPPTLVNISTASTFQSIDGFGAGVVFLDAGLDPQQDAWMDALYGTGPNQMGLTLIRVRIDPTGNWTNAIIDGQKATQRGARILATPWTPPAAMKTNGSLIHGSLSTTSYGDYVNHLNSFTDAMAAGGAPVSVVSVQNEPDWDADYEGCVWTPTQLLNFCRDFAGGITVPVMMPESLRYDPAYSNPTLNDPVARNNVDYLGGHLYGAGVQDNALGRTLGKHMWMTEYLVNDQTIGTAIDTARQVSDCLTTGYMSGYIWWKTIGNANGLLNASGVLQRRAYVMGQFSRFIRPGDVRISASGNTSPMNITSFKDPASGRFAIVVVNGTNANVNHKFNLTGLPVSAVVPWVTSATDSLTEKAPVAVAANSFTYEIPAMSVVTFSIKPAITSANKAAGTHGVPFSHQVTSINGATSYGASGLPDGLTINSATGLISGTPTAAGLFDVAVVAGNATGYGEQVLTLDITPFSVTRGGFLLNRRTNQVNQQVTLKNVSGQTFNGPFYLVLDSLSSNTSLVNATGTTSGGSPYVAIPSGPLAPGGSVSVVLQFTLPSSGGITYNPRTPNAL